MPTLAARVVLPVIVAVALAAVTTMIVMISNEDEKKRQSRLRAQQLKQADN